jgi:NAD(P)-dependent dehydrogenase (short-subunit alcohol dehydrogenase family)
MANCQVIVVTGSNRGIGKGIVQLLAKQKHERPVTIYATSRSGADTNIQVFPPNEVRYSKLDISDQSSIQSFFQLAGKEHSKIDALINNAAVSNDYRETPEYATQTVTTNYGGTRDMCEAFLSTGLCGPGSRIVNITSGYNQLSNYGQAIEERFRALKTISDVDALAESYLDAVKCGEDVQQQSGWGSGARSYKVSKALINALTVVIAQQHPEVLVNCCCPGWVNTDMGNQAKGNPPKTPEEGARIPVRLAIGDLGPKGDEAGGLGNESERVSGKFFENDNILERGWGKAHLWLKL